MTLPVEVHRCQYEIWLALCHTPHNTADPNSYGAARHRSAIAGKFSRKYKLNFPCYPDEYCLKIDKHLKKNPRPIVQIALERLVRAGYFDRALEIKAFLREHNPNLLED